MRSKPIEGYGGKYIVYEDGIVVSMYRYTSVHGKLVRVDKPKVLKPIKTPYGYLRVSLRKNMKTHTVFIHRLVAEAFVDNPNGKPFVNHKDENKMNNNADNLEWVTSAENNNYGTAPQRTAETLREYYKAHPYAVAKSVRCVETGIVYPTITQAGKALGINFRNISACLRGEANRPTAGGYHWEFV